MIFRKIRVWVCQYWKGHDFEYDSTFGPGPWHGEHLFVCRRCGYCCDEDRLEEKKYA